jgi:hypothetical protein
MKKTILLVLLVLMVSVALVAAAPGFEKLARLTIWNRTGSTIYIKLTTPKDNGNLHYYLTIKTGWHVYTVQRELYDITYWSCGNSTTGIADIYTQLSLTFVNCNYLHDTPYGAYRYYGSTYSDRYVTDGRRFNNVGEPSMEKVQAVVKVWMWDNQKTHGCILPGQTKTSQNIVDCAANPTAKWYNDVKLVEQNNDGTYSYVYYWRHKSYGSPWNPGTYWYAWRLSYSNTAGYYSARDVHWFVRDSKSIQVY